MKTLITILTLFITSQTFAQFPQVIPDSGTIKYQAEQLTDKYNRQLALTGIQIPLFKEVVEKYIQLANEAKDQYEGQQELDMLLELQARETLQMNDILTQPQYRLYKKLKFEYQPLKTVDPEKEKS